MEKEGYEDRTFYVSNGVGAGWIILDVVFGLLPVIVDAATGSWYSLDKDHIHFELETAK